VSGRSYLAPRIVYMTKAASAVGHDLHISLKRLARA
jgi:hypothetical protein